VLACPEVTLLVNNAGVVELRRGAIVLTGMCHAYRERRPVTAAKARVLSRCRPVVMLRVGRAMPQTS
jgi:hypothetical protein